MDKENLTKEFLSVEGIDKKIALKLINAGVKSISDLKLQNPQKLSKKIGYPQKTIIKWIASANDAIKNKELVESEEIILKLKTILKIPYREAKILRNVGIFSINDLANEEPIQLSEDSGIHLYYISQWIKKARQRIKNIGH